MSANYRYIGKRICCCRGLKHSLLARGEVSAGMPYSSLSAWRLTRCALCALWKSSASLHGGRRRRAPLTHCLAHSATPARKSRAICCLRLRHSCTKAERIASLRGSITLPSYQRGTPHRAPRALPRLSLALPARGTVPLPRAGYCNAWPVLRRGREATLFAAKPRAQNRYINIKHS